MKLLFDENPSPSLAHRLADLFPDSAHVHRLGLGKADDATILRSRAQAIKALADDETGIIDIR